MGIIKAKVIGELPVCGVTAGGYVDLDPEKYVIGALVDGGHIELSKTAAKTLDEVTTTPASTQRDPAASA